MNKKLLQLYGLKFNPFSPELPTEALRTTPAVESFLWKLEHGLAREGGFALITGESGTESWETPSRSRYDPITDGLEPKHFASAGRRISKPLFFVPYSSPTRPRR